VDISTDRARLNNLFKDLNLRWLKVQSEWTDLVRKEFEETHWFTLDQRVQAALRAMDHMANVLTQVRHDCS
jgi:hypothetical protein